MFSTLILLLCYIPGFALFGYLIYLVIKALRKYIRSEPVRKEKTETARSLGEVLKNQRVARPIGRAGGRETSKSLASPA